MASVIINDDNLKNIAEAIREKGETNETYTPSEMADAIRSISGGGTPNAVQYVSQELTSEQQTQARANIGAQQKLTGSAGQIVGFDASGNAVAQDAPSGGGDSSVTIDTTLSVEGAAAEAKSTGTKIATAQSTATNAQTTANNAQTTANNANTAAADAKTAANNASTSAYMAMPGTLKWDGTIGDKEYVVIEQSEILIALVHVSDTVPMMLDNTCFVSMAGLLGESPSQQTNLCYVIQNEDGSYIISPNEEISDIDDMVVFIAPTDNCIFNGLSFPKKGVYFLAYSYLPLGIDFSLTNVSGLKTIGTSFSESCPMESRFETVSKTLSSETIGTTLTWDGTTDGYETISLMGTNVVRLADCTLSYEELATKTITGSITMSDGTIVEATNITIENTGKVSGILLADASGNSYTIYVAHTDNAVVEILVLPKAGFYFINQDGVYISSLSLGDYTFILSQSETSTYLKYEHLPEALRFGEIETEIRGDTLTWDGNTEGKINLDGEGFYLVSDAVPTLAELQKGGTVLASTSAGAEESVQFDAANVGSINENGTVLMVASGLR